MRKKDNAHGRGRVKPDALAEGIAERLRVVYSRESMHGGGAINRLTRRLNSLARVAGLPSVNRLRFAERHKVFLEACARGYGSHPAAEELLRVLAELESWAAEHAKRKAEAPKPTPAPDAFLSDAARSKAELLKDLPAWGLAQVTRDWRARPFGALVLDCDDFARYNLRKGDDLFFTMDGDAEHGELAFVTHYNDGVRYYFAAFLAVHGSHFCLRTNLLECDDDHHDAERLTIVGRAFRVERGGLPVRLKDLTLRGLPFAEDLPPAREEED